MKLYSQVCFGLVFVFLCQTEKPAVVSDFCRQTAGEIGKFQHLTDVEIAALQRQRKEAIVSLRRKYARLCK